MKQQLVKSVYNNKKAEIINISKLLETYIYPDLAWPGLSYLVVVPRHFHHPCQQMVHKVSLKFDPFSFRIYQENKENIRRIV